MKGWEYRSGEAGKRGIYVEWVGGVFEDRGYKNKLVVGMIFLLAEVGVGGKV